MFVFLAVMIVIGLLPITMQAVLTVSPNRQVNMSITIGPMTIRPKIGQGKAELPWLKKLAKKIKPPIPARQLVYLFFNDISMTSLSVDIMMGLDEAGPTAIATGLLSTILTVIGIRLKAASEAANSENTKVRVRVVPDYNHISFMMNAQVAMHTRFGRLVHLAVKLIILSILHGMRRRTQFGKMRPITAKSV